MAVGVNGEQWFGIGLLVAAVVIFPTVIAIGKAIETFDRITERRRRARWRCNVPNCSICSGRTW